MYVFYAASTLAILPLAWWKGAAPERQGVLFLLVNYLAAGVFDGLNFYWAALANDGLLLVGLLWLSRIHRRWWILLAAAMQILVLVAHYSYLEDLGIGSRTDVLYRWLLGVIGLYALGLGPVERWLAHEPPGGWPRFRSLPT